MYVLEWTEGANSTSEERSSEEHRNHFAGFAEDLRGVVHMLERAVRKYHGQRVADAVDAVVGQSIGSKTDVLRSTIQTKSTSSFRMVRSRVSPSLSRKDILASPPSKEISWIVHSSLPLKRKAISTPCHGF